MKNDHDLEKSMKIKGISTKMAIGAAAGVLTIIAILHLAYLSHKKFEETVVSQTQGFKQPHLFSKDPTFGSTS